MAAAPSPDPHLVSLLLWAALLLLLVCLGVVTVLSASRIVLRLNVRLLRQGPGRRALLRSAVFASAVLLVSILALLITARESWTTRFGVICASLVVGVVGVHFIWNRIRDSARIRTDEATYWQRRAIEVGGALDTIENAADARAYLVENLVSELGLAACGLYEKRSDRFEPTHGFPMSAAPEDVWDGDGLLPSVLGSTLPPTALVVADPSNGSPVNWAPEGGARLAEEQERLRSRDARIVVGFRRNSGFAGFLLLSARTDSAPFTAPQLGFMESLGAHLGRTLDSLERIERLLEISREMERDALEDAVLLRARGFLAPPERPEVPGVEYAWELWRGQFPGNSMFDAVALPNRSLGLVLADAEGSGLEAAIRLIQLQALLRSRFWAYSDDLRELLESTERALLAARNESRPLRLFCARYRPLTRTLHFVNAGYYPPMLLRVHSQGAEILRLASRGGAICDPARTELVEEEIPLGPGDLLAIASPGVAAARSPGKEFWGESRLADTLLSWEGQPLQDMARLTLRTVEEFSGQDPTLPPRSLILLRQQSPHFSEAPVSGGTPPTG